MKVTREIEIDVHALPIPLRLKEVGKSKASIPIESLSEAELGRVAEEWKLRLLKQAKVLRGQPKTEEE